MSCLVGIEFSHNHRGSRPRGLSQYTLPLPSYGFTEKIARILESLLLNEGAIGRDEAELLDRALIDKFIVIIGRRGFFTGPVTFRAHFFLFVRH